MLLYLACSLFAQPPYDVIKLNKYGAGDNPFSPSGKHLVSNVVPGEVFVNNYHLFEHRSKLDSLVAALYTDEEIPDPEMFQVLVGINVYYCGAEAGGFVAGTAITTMAGINLSLRRSGGVSPITFHSDFPALVLNKLRGGLCITAVKAPGFGYCQKVILEYFAILTGAYLC